jgi:membrane fusion protein, multidrug efflux system
MPASLRRKLAFFAVMAAAAGLAAGLSACSTNENGPGQGPGMGQAGERPPAPVTYITVQSEQVRVDADFAGRLHGSREAEVRARVGGILEERLYEEGGFVEQGAALFRIDQAPFEIALQRAEAELANARAALSQALREWRRVSGLFEQGAISERERDRALSDRELTEARAALAEAGVARARLDLGYTTVAAPISGVTGLETVTEGNLVSSGTLLTTITQLDPIHVRFALPAGDAAARRELLANGGTVLLAAELLLADGSRYEHTGTVDFTASTVDPHTGSVMVRAVFPNPDGKLNPGALARVRLAVTRLDGVYRVDAAAVSQGAGGPVVFVVDGVETARARPVELGPVLNGEQVILDGLEDGDRVIVNGQVALRDGARVQAKPREERGE